MAFQDPSYFLTVVRDNLYIIVPNVLLFIFLILCGWILGKISKKVTSDVLNKLRLDYHFKFGKKIELTEILSIGVSWVVYLVFLRAAIEILKIQSLLDFFNITIGFVINLLGGIVILIVGYIIAIYIQKKITQSGMYYSQVFSQILFVFTVIITIEMALKVVGLPTELLDVILIIIVASIGIGLAIAIGLGLKDTVNRFARKYFED